MVADYNSDSITSEDAEMAIQNATHFLSAVKDLLRAEDGDDLVSDDRQ